MIHLRLRLMVTVFVAFVPQIPAVAFDWAHHSSPDVRRDRNSTLGFGL